MAARSDDESNRMSVAHSRWTTNAQSLVAPTRFCSFFWVLYGLMVVTARLVQRRAATRSGRGGVV